MLYEVTLNDILIGDLQLVIEAPTDEDAAWDALNISKEYQCTLMDVKPMKKKEFPNNWAAVKAAPSEYFEECTYEEFVDWRLRQWEIPASISCIIRAEHILTGKITEHIYSRQYAAESRLKKYLKDRTHNIVVANHTSIHQISITPPMNVSEFEDE